MHLHLHLHLPLHLHLHLHLHLQDEKASREGIRATRAKQEVQDKVERTHYYCIT